MSQLIQDFAVDAAIGVAFAALLALVIGWLLKQEDAPRKVLVALSLLIVAVLSVEGWRIYSHHGAWHASIVYSILERGLPPEYALVAGESVQYMYTFHYLVAMAMHVIPLAPPWFFALLNVVTFVATFLVLDRLAALVDDDKRYRALAVTLALVGFVALINAPIGTVLNEILGIPDTSQIDPIHKFATVNNNQIGILSFAVACLGFAKIVRGADLSKGFMLIAVGYLGIGLFYPLLIVEFGIITSAAIVQLSFFASPRRYKDASLAFGVLGAGALVVVPWALVMGGDRASSGSIQLISLANIGTNTYFLLAMLAVPVAVFWTNGGRIRAMVSGGSPVVVFLVLTIFGLLVAYLLSVAGLSANLERKILTASQIPIGIVIALAFREMAKLHFRIFLLIFTFLWLPVAYKWGPILVRGWELADPATTSGIAYVHEDADQNEIYTWILENTRNDAVFVDSYLTIPTFARRSLYLGVDIRRDSGDRHGYDGWGNRADYNIAKTNGIAEEIVAPRMKVVSELLATSGAPLDEALVLDARQHVPGRDFFVIARDPRISKRLGESRVTRRVFANESASIFAVGEFDAAAKSDTLAQKVEADLSY